MSIERELSVAQLGVRELTDVLQSVLMDNPDAILLIDASGVIRMVNPAAEEMLGRLAGQLVGASFGYPVATGLPAEIDLLTRGEIRAVEMHVAETVWGGAGVFIATLRDVTERRRAEETVRDFVSMASHELRSPVTSIAGFADTLLKHWADLEEGDRTRYLHVIDRQARRLSRLASDLLELSRMDAGALAPIPTEVALDAVIGNIVEELHEDGEVTITGAAGITVEADLDHVQQILINYLTNAFKYGAAPVTVEVAQEDGEARILVRDHGEGVPPMFQARLFERFARAASGRARKAQGTGLGLAIVRGLAEANGGRVWYEPNSPTGSCFGVALPRDGHL